MEETKNEKKEIKKTAKNPKNSKREILNNKSKNNEDIEMEIEEEKNN